VNGIMGDDVAILVADWLGDPGSEPDGFIEGIERLGGGGDGIVVNEVISRVKGGLSTMVSGVHPGRGNGYKRIGVSGDDGIFTLCAGQVDQGIGGGHDVRSSMAGNEGSDGWMKYRPAGDHSGASCCC
jgi:hypothetical protein